MSFSINYENQKWLKDNAESYDMGVSTFLNQVIREARGKPSMLAHNPDFKDLSQRVEKMILDSENIKKDKRTQFLEKAYNAKWQEWDSSTMAFWSKSIAKEQFGITDMTPEEITAYIDAKEAEKHQTKINHNGNAEDNKGE